MTDVKIKIKQLQKADSVQDSDNLILDTDGYAKRVDVKLLGKYATRDFQAQLDRLVLAHGDNTNYEVVQARSTYTTLNERLTEKEHEFEDGIEKLRLADEEISRNVADNAAAIAGNAAAIADNAANITNHKLVLDSNTSELLRLSSSVTSLENTKANKTDIPTTLPANGGNADTVQGFNGYRLGVRNEDQSQSAKYVSPRYIDAYKGYFIEGSQETPVIVNKAINSDEFGGKMPVCYVQRFGLNEYASINDIKDVSFTMDITVDSESHTDSGLPNGWWQIHQYTSGHFYTQVAVMHNDKSGEVYNKVLYRRKYTTGAWNSWTKIGAESNPNLLINGDFQVWQRGTSFTNPNEKYTADRWKAELGTVSDTTITKTNDGLFIRHTKTNNQWEGIVQIIENNPTIRNSVVTLSAYVKSNVGVYCLIRAIRDTGKYTLVRSNVHTGDNTWQLLKCTIDLSTVDDFNNLISKMQFDNITSGEMYIKYMKLELGNTATPFVPRPYAEELMLCERYDGDDAVIPYKNPNILINGDFQVWQRGNLIGGTVCYTADRWAIGTNGRIEVSKIDGGARVSVTSVGTWHNFYQIIEVPPSVRGKTFTMSVKLKTPSRIRQMWAIQYNSEKSSNKYCASMTTDEYSDFFKMSFTPSNDYPCDLLEVGVQLKNEVYSIDIESIKLELGDEATPLSPRPYAEELAMCQRYYRKFKYEDMPYFKCSSHTYVAYSDIFFDNKMRTTPTVTISGNLVAVDLDTGGEVELNSPYIENWGTNKSISHLRITSSGKLTAGKIYSVRIKDDSFFISYDAEIY